MIMLHVSTVLQTENSPMIWKFALKSVYKLDRFHMKCCYFMDAFKL